MAIKATTNSKVIPFRRSAAAPIRISPLELFLGLAIIVGVLLLLSPADWRSGLTTALDRLIPAVETPSPRAPASDATATVIGPARVIDGDTLEIDGQRIRLFGVDAFERNQTCGAGAATWACGRAGAEALERRLDGREVACEPVDTDRYGRLVARCRTGGEDLGGWLTARGLALAYRRYSLEYVEAEDAARSSRLGVWRDGVTTSPEEWRREGR